jgi:excisionase family DNA binding protein
VAELLTDVEVAEYLRVSLATVRRWRAEGTGPPWFRAGRAIRYSRRALDEWIERQERERDRGS